MERERVNTIIKHLILKIIYGLELGNIGERYKNSLAALRYKWTTDRVW